MTSRSHIENTIKALWAARLCEDVEATIKDFAEDGVFEMNARGIGGPGLAAPIVGKPALREALRGFYATWDFKDWRTLDLLVDGEKALVRWRAHVTCTPTGKSEVFECYDLIGFRDGKIVDYRQTTDTAMMMKLAS
ncbi:MAG: nuclear transport factor 2 family protein [Reyranella sp.]|nr:nuclear transport factor 2 family protein [Reyranella sp.]